MRDDNIDAVVKYLLASEAEAKKSKPKAKKSKPKAVKLKDVKKLKPTNSYSITPLGRDFLIKIQG